jgi:hypothetical protein
MIPLEALIYSFLFGLLHGILPDEHTWPITFSYAIGWYRHTFPKYEPPRKRTLTSMLEDEG